MDRFKRLGVILLIFLGPGSVIYFISKTFSNHFIKLPYIGTQYTYNELGEKKDSTLFEIPNFELTKFDGSLINKDSLLGKFTILTTIQNECPGMDECGLGIYLFNEILYHKMLKNADNYHNVRVLSILTDGNGFPVDQPTKKLTDYMSGYDQSMWWLATGDPLPLYSFDYYGDIFSNHLASNDLGEIGTQAFTSSLVLIDDKGHIRGVSGAKSDTDIRNFFDMLKLLKKEEFDANRANK